MKNLYNQDGSLCSEAQSLLISPKPETMTTAEWRKKIKKFKSSLSEQHAKTFTILRKKAVANATAAKWYVNHSETAKLKSSLWRKQNPDKVKQQLNSTQRKEYDKSYLKTKRKTDPFFRFVQTLRVNCHRAVHRLSLRKKPTNTFKWVGCSAEEFKAHIESLFLEGMTWDNYGKRGWHVDHIRPVSSFNPEEWEQINHYTNLQPLWWQDNLKKGNSWR